MQKVPYEAHPHVIRDGHTYLTTANSGEVSLQVFGLHNMKNIAGALTVCDQLGITDEQFYEAIQTFRSATQLLETVVKTDTKVVFRDFAHAPSKVEAATQAVKAQYPNQKLLVCVELHTFGSLSKTFLNEYHHTLDAADLAAVYYNTDTLVTKSLAPLSADDVLAAFDKPGLRVFTETSDLESFIKQNNQTADIFLMMSSAVAPHQASGPGTFGGLDLTKLM